MSSRINKKLRYFKLITGLTMLLLSIILVCLLFFRPFHFTWWSDKTYFLWMTILGVLFATLGSFLVRSHIYRGKQKEDLHFEIMGYVGFMLVMGGFLLGGGALIIAMDVNNYTGVGTDESGSPTAIADHVYSYPQDWLVMDSQVLLLCFAIIIAILGQFLIGFSKNRASEYI